MHRYALCADAPWCIHCQRLTPVWNQLADLYTDYDDVIVAQIDVTTNDVSGVEINAFPTIKLYGKDGHTVEGLLLVVAVTGVIVVVVVTVGLLQPPRSTQPGRPFLGRRNEYQPKGGDALQLGSKCRYGSRVCGG